MLSEIRIALLLWPVLRGEENWTVDEVLLAPITQDDHELPLTFRLDIRTRHRPRQPRLWFETASDLVQYLVRREKEVPSAKHPELLGCSRPPP